MIFKSFKALNPKELGTRKKVEIYIGIDLKSFYTFVMSLEKKSRVLLKEARELGRLHEEAERYLGSKIMKKILLIDAPLCSKAKAWLETEGWKVMNVAES